MNKKRILIFGVVLVALCLLVYLQFRTWKKFDWATFRNTTEHVNKLDLLAGIALTRRFMLIVSAAVLLAVAALATPFNDQPRYNVSLMALLLCSGTIGAWLAGERLLAMWHERQAESAPAAPVVS